MIFGNNSLGKSVIHGTQFILPTLTNYTKITFNGSNNGSIISKVWGRTVPMSEDTITFYDSVPTWTIDTYILALFNDSLSAGNILGFKNEIQKWLVYKENTENNVLSYVDEVDAETRSCLDYTSLLNKTYRYYLFALNSEQLSTPLVSNYILSSYYAYFLIDATDDIVYVFNAEVSGGDLTQNMNYSKFDGNTKFGKYSVGVMNYLSSSLTGLVKLSTDVDYMQTTDIITLKQLENFINDPTKKKILKTRKGETFEVFTYNYVETPFEQSVSSQPMLVSFSFDQIGEMYEQ